MATQAFPPTPAQVPPNATGKAVASGQPDIQNIIRQAGQGMQALQMLAKIVGQQKPEAAQKIAQGIAAIKEAVGLLKGAPNPNPTSPQGSVPPPPDMAGQSPETTPEAT